MKKLNINEYNPSFGVLIDVQHPDDYLKNPTLGSINIYSDKLLMNYKTILDKSKKYYVYCRHGSKSRRLASILEIYNYDVTQVLLDN